MKKSKIPGFVQHFATTERRKKRALVKLFGIRQYKRNRTRLERLISG